MAENQGIESSTKPLMRGLYGSTEQLKTCFFFCRARSQFYVEPQLPILTTCYHLGTIHPMMTRREGVAMQEVAESLDHLCRGIG